MFLAARGRPDLGLVVATVRRRHPVGRQRDALNCVYDRDIDEQMRRTRRRALPRHTVSPRAALVFGARARRAVRPCSCSALGQLALGGARAGRQRVLRRRLHDAAQAAHHPEHRLGRRRRLLPGADRLDRGHRLAGLGAGGAVPGRLLLDAAALLGAGAALPRGLRRRRRADAARRSRRPPWSAARSSLYSWVMVATSLLLWPVADDRLVLPGRRRRARRGVPRRGAPAVAPYRAAPTTSR